MGKLILVRHGKTPLNHPGQDERLRGWLDVPLDEKGMEEAQAIAAQLRGRKIAVIYSSDLRRARQTAQTLRRAITSRVVATKDLRPWNLGVFCGHRVRDLLPFLNHLSQHPDVAPPGGESYYQFFGRYSARLRELMRLAEGSADDIVAVTHVRNLLVTRTIVEHGDPDRAPVRGGPPTGTLIAVEKREGTWQFTPELDDLPSASTKAREHHPPAPPTGNRGRTPGCVMSVAEVYVR